MTETSETAHPKYAQIRETLLAYIREMKLGPGDRLPSERQLAAQMGVNRLTVRRGIKSLCETSIICQVPKSGTYVAEQQPRRTGAEATQEDDVSALMAEGSFFSSGSQTVLRFHIEDTLPEQRRAWDAVLREFERRHTGIVVDPDYSEGRVFAVDDGSRFDVGLVTPRQLHAVVRRDAPLGRVFGPTWMAEHPLSPQLRHAESRIMEPVRRDTAQVGIPLLYGFSLLFVNRRRTREPLTDMMAPQALVSWTAEAVRDDALCCPFAQSTLNLLVRQNRDVLVADGAQIDLSVPGCREWLEAKRDLLGRQPKLLTATPSEIVRNFLAGDAAVCDLQTNALCLLAERFAPGLDALGAHLQCMQPAGVTQLLPRYLVARDNAAVTPQLLVLANFLAGDWAQTEMARRQLGLPFYLGDDGVETFCERGPLTADQIHRELAAIGGVYADPLFVGNFEPKTLNPMLRAFCDGSISLEQQIHHFRHIATDVPSGG
jgi:DNA-binding transcriptional regulator YhcF (GntR family)